MILAIESYVFAVFGALMCVACAGAAYAEYRRTRELLTPATLFMAMAAFDIYLPGAIRLVTGRLPTEPPWLPALWFEAVPEALLVFTVGLVLFVIGYVAVTRPGRRQAAEASFPAPIARIRVSRAWFVLLFSLATYVWWVSSDMRRGESLDQFFSRRLMQRFMPHPIEADNFVMALMLRMAPAMLGVFFVMVGVLFTGRRRSPLLCGGALPALGLLVAASTLYRGTVLTYLIGLLLIATQPGPESRRGRLTGTLARAVTRGRIVAFLVVTVSVFSAYGAARSYFTVRSWGPSLRALTSPGVIDATVLAGLQFIRGEGLISLASILVHYPERGDFFAGKTFTDVLLLPVPRTLWPDKPAWYGIDDITRAMGGPETTQTPVTMPGELYANFGYPGTALMLGYGIIFGWVYRWRQHPRLRFIYAFLLVPLVTVTAWMAFTGFVNQLVTIPLTWLSLLFVVAPRRPRVTPGAQSRPRPVPAHG